MSESNLLTYIPSSFESRDAVFSSSAAVLVNAGSWYWQTSLAGCGAGSGVEERYVKCEIKI
jgi:hypothetical protein